MSLFGLGKPELDPTLGDKLAKKLAGAAKLGNIDALLKEVDPIRNGQWNERAFYINLISEYLTNLERVQSLPDTALGNLMKGAVAIELASKARGAGTADTVSDEGWKIFVRDLDMAAQCLLRAGAQDPEDPTPFAFLQTIAMGLQLKREQAVEWLDEALKRDPHNQTAHFRHMGLLCEKWGGSHDEMFAFARGAVKKAPTGSRLSAILYYAFQEYYLYFKAFEKDPDKINALLASSAVRDESLAVYDKALRGREIERVSEYHPHNLAVWWFYVLNVPEIVRLETRKIGPYFTEFPWRMFYKDPAEAYRRATKL